MLPASRFHMLLLGLRAAPFCRIALLQTIKLNWEMVLRSEHTSNTATSVLNATFRMDNMCHKGHDANSESPTVPRYHGLCWAESPQGYDLIL